VPPIIQARELTKRYPSSQLPAFLRRAKDVTGPLAVDNATFDVHAGEIFGLIGPNGAGKTTLIKMLATLILPTSGTATIGGVPLTRAARIQPMIGLMTHNERSFFPRLSCYENLRFYGGLAQVPQPARRERIRHLAEMLDLADYLEQRYDRCSTGIRHRLALARAMINDAALLLLDEPTATLDPVAAGQFRERLYTLVHQEARTVLMVTHNVDEAVAICDRVAVMVAGHLHVVGAPDRLHGLLRSDARCSLHVRGASPDLPARLLDLDAVVDIGQQQVTADVTQLEVQLQDQRHSLRHLIAALEADGGSVERLQLATATWDEVVERLQNDAAPDEEQSDQDGLVADQGADTRPHPPRRLPRLQIGARLRELRQTLPLFLQRDLRTQVSYRLSFLLQLAGILFSVTSYYFVGRIFGGQANPYLSAYGGDYFSFVLIGIAFLGYQSVALYGFSGVVQSAQTRGTLEAMLATPTRLSTILLGSSAWDFVFTTARVALYLLAGALLFGARFTGADWPAALLVLLLTVVCLSAIGILSASFIMIYKRGSPINFLISGVTLLLGGVYYPIEVLPPALQTVARLYPLTISLQAMRRALLTGASLTSLAGDLALLLAYTVLLVPLGLAAFGYAVRQAKRDGSLTQF